jgi:type I restriction enzyme R subunit
VKSFIAESGVEEVCLDYLADLDWYVLYGPEIAPGEPRAERPNYREVILEDRLRSAIARLNPGLTPAVIDAVLATVRRPESADVLAENWRIYRLLTTGVPVERRTAEGESRHDVAWLVDFEHPERNEFVAVNQYTVEGDQSIRRPDIVLFVNGMPLGVVELKVPGEDRATLREVFPRTRAPRHRRRAPVRQGHGL